MKLICLTFLLISRTKESSSEQYKVVGSADPVFAVAGEDVILPCSVKPNISVVDMKVEWFRLDQKYSVVHLYEDHKDRNTEQIQPYRGRTELSHPELQTGNAALKLSTVKVSDEGRYKCFIQSKSWSDDATVVVSVEAVGSPPVITVDGFDRSGGLHLQCESEGWYPEPDLEWLDSEGVRLSPKTTETHRNTDGFSVKHTIIFNQRDGKIHCRVKLRHHMLETLITTTSNMFNSWRTLVIFIIVLSVIAGILITVIIHKYRVHNQLRKAKIKIEQEREQLLQSQKVIIPKVIGHLRKTTAVNVTLDADSAHPDLIVSEDGKEVTFGTTQMKQVDGKNGRFTEYHGVLGKEGFSSGCFYFEVQVKDQTEWYLGVTRESANRKGSISMSPLNGYWTVSLTNGRYWARKSSIVNLSLKVKPQRVCVFGDYEKGLVSFYDVKNMFHIYSYTDQSFNEKLYPFVCFVYHLERSSTPLRICDDY